MINFTRIAPLNTANHLAFNRNQSAFRHVLPSFSLLCATRTSLSSSFISSSRRYSSENDIKAKLEALVQKHFSTHPFSTLLNAENSQRVLGAYLAMSQSFPFIQAGAYQNIIVSAIKRNLDIQNEVEKTFAVGSFLCWDETGGHHVIQSKGTKALPEILNTKSQFHSNLLKRDLKKIYGIEISPNYKGVTRDYLLELGNRLGDEDHIKRCAMMVAFETHANQMISSLWEALSSVHHLEKEELLYFKTHVGGEDPAEAYHVAMTERLISTIVPQEKLDGFFSHFLGCYSLNFNWCAAICHPTTPFTRSSEEIDEMKKNGFWTAL